MSIFSLRRPFTRAPNSGDSPPKFVPDVKPVLCPASFGVPSLGGCGCLNPGGLCSGHDEASAGAQEERDAARSAGVHDQRAV